MVRETENEPNENNNEIDVVGVVTSQPRQLSGTDERSALRFTESPCHRRTRGVSIGKGKCVLFRVLFCKITKKTGLSRRLHCCGVV